MSDTPKARPRPSTAHPRQSAKPYVASPPPTKSNIRKLIQPMQTIHHRMSCKKSSNGDYESALRSWAVEDCVVADPILGLASSLPILAEVTRIALKRLDNIEVVVSEYPKDHIPFAWPVTRRQRLTVRRICEGYPPTSRVSREALKVLGLIDNPPPTWRRWPPAPHEDEVALGLVRACIWIAEQQVARLSHCPGTWLFSS